MEPRNLRHDSGASRRRWRKGCRFRLPLSRARAGDDAFRAALERFRPQAVIGSNFVSPENINRSSKIPSSYDPPTETLIPKTPTPDERVGFTNFFADENKIVRGAQYRVDFREPGASMATYLSLSARVVSKTGHPELIPNDLAEHFIRFTGAPRKGFRPRPLFEIFVPEYWEHNYRSGELIRDKIVIIGAEGKWQKDELNTPFGTMPGAEVHLNALNALLHGEFLKDLSPFPKAAVTILAALVGFGLWVRIRSPWLRLLALGGGLRCAILRPLVLQPSKSLSSLPGSTSGTQLERSLLPGRRFHIRARRESQTSIDLANAGRPHPHDRSRSAFPFNYGYRLCRCIGTNGLDKLNPDEAKCVAGAKRGAIDMRDMITTLLDVSRLEAGKMPLHLQDHNLAVIVREAANRFTPVLQSRTLSVRGASRVGLDLL